MTPDPNVLFRIEQRCPETSARAGVIDTAHGEIPTPAFAPVGTLGMVKAATPRDLHELGARLIMVNAYHLALRPGTDTVASLGGVHRLAGWSGPVMADSGGYQVFSLGELAETDAEGVTIRSPHDGSAHRFTPESVIALQRALGADLAMPLDVCTTYPATEERAAADMAITHDWARRALEAHDAPGQILYGIVQGSTHRRLRAESAAAIARMGFRAFAIGGVSVGETKHEMMLAIESSVPSLPDDAPRHLLGVGHPDDIVEAVARGIDTFDCVMPTRVARNAGALSRAGRMNLRNASYRTDDRPLETNCSCYACQTFSRAAIRHYLMSGEILGLHLLTLHNLHFTLELVRAVRQSIVAGNFSELRAQLARQLGKD